mgnify:CR=1 FL=1
MAYAGTACITHVSPYDSSEAISAERRCKNVLKSLQSDIVMYDTRRAAASINFYNMNYGEVIDIFENLEFKTLFRLCTRSQELHVFLPVGEVSKYCTLDNFSSRDFGMCPRRFSIRDDVLEV